MIRLLQLTLIASLLAALGWLMFYWQPLDSVGDSRGTLGIAAVPQGGDFVLQSWRGPLSLRDLRGKVVLLYFGYTWCPDICPTNLGYVSLAFDLLLAEELQQVIGLFISVDPQRDSPERLKAYTEYFHPNILGITGDAKQIAVVAKNYGAAFTRGELPSTNGYLVDHSAYTYVIDRAGRLHSRLDHGTPPEDIVHRIRAILAAKVVH